MKWSEIDDKERVHLVVEHILGWSIWEPKDEREADQYLAGHGGHVYPFVAWHNDQGFWHNRNCWVVYHDDSTSDESAPSFDPLHNMNDAWLVVRRMNELSGDYPYFIDELERIVGSTLFFDLFSCGPDGDHLAPERICLAALRSEDVEEVFG